MTDAPLPPPDRFPDDHPVDAAKAAVEETGATAWLRRELSSGTVDQILRWLAGAMRFVRRLGLAVLVVGLLGLALAVAAFRDNVGVLIVLAVLSLPAIVAPLLALRYTGRLAEAARQPSELVRQARDLASGVVDSQELRELAGQVTRRGRGAEGPVKVGKIRRARHTAKLASTVIGQAQPDKERHRLLLPFAPERLTRMSGSIVWTGWGLAISFVVIVISIGALIVHAL